MMASGEHYKAIPRTHEKSITLADTPYTLPLGYNCVKVDTTGGNVRVNLPDTNYPIDVIKTSSDAYIVTVWVGGTQIGEVAEELSKITVENAEVTKDEPWYPYDAIVGIAGVSGDGGEVLAKDRYGKVIAGGRGVAGTDDQTVLEAAWGTSGKRVLVTCTLNVSNLTMPKDTILEGINPAVSVLLHNNVGNEYTLKCIGDGSVWPGQIRNIKFAANGTTNNCALLLSTYSRQRFQVDACKFSGGYIDNIRAYGTYCASITQCEVVEHRARGVVLGDIGIGPTNNVVIDRSYIGQALVFAGSIGVAVQYAGSSIIQNSTLESNQYEIVYGQESSAVYNASLAGNYFENVAANGPVAISLISMGVGILVNTKIRDNHMSGYATIINIIDGHDTHVSGNDFWNSTVADIAVCASAEDTHIEKNTITGTVSDSGTRTKFEENSGYRTNNFGSETGTGSEQAIPHGLAAIPVGCKAWITYLVGTRYVTEMIPFDATNVYPTVATGTAYNWRIE